MSMDELIKDLEKQLSCVLEDAEFYNKFWKQNEIQAIRLKDVIATLKNRSKELE